jgi:Tripartite tricarboxylate transporter TctB family
MQSSRENPGLDGAARSDGSLITPRSDFIAALGWIAFGIAVAIGSWQMDRLENQDVAPYAVPGLLPFFLGLAIVFFSTLMLARAWRQGALAKDAIQAAGMSMAERKRFLIVLSLCLTFGIVLVGHGLPFWLAGAIFVSATISVLQYPQRRAANQVVRGIALSIVIGLCAGFGVTLVFQEFFLVRFP